MRLQKYKVFYSLQKNIIDYFQENIKFPISKSQITLKQMIKNLRKEKSFLISKFAHLEEE